MISFLKVRYFADSKISLAYALKIYRWHDFGVIGGSMVRAGTGQKIIFNLFLKSWVDYSV